MTASTPDIRSSVDGDIVVVGATRDAADDFVRAIARRRPAKFGIHRFSLAQFASRITRLDAARRGTMPASSLMVDALTARACFQAAEHDLSYFSPIATAPGFSHAVRRTVEALGYRLGGQKPNAGGPTNDAPES